MEKENNQDDSYLKKKGHQEWLEYSSTGYGLESVTNESSQDRKINDQNNGPSCGGT